MSAYLSCTCATGRCARTGHVPQPAQCGHPGVFGHVNGRSVCQRPTCAAVAGTLARDFPSQETIGRAIGALTGAAGRKGGWIYDQKGRPICQGWASFAHERAGTVRHGETCTSFDYVAGKGYRIREEGLRRVARYLDTLRAGMTA